MDLINGVVRPTKGKATFFHLMYEIARMSFLDERYAAFMFKKNNDMPHLIRNFTMSDELDASEYRACILNGGSYDVDFNVMLIKIPNYDKELFFALSFKTFFYNGVKTVTFCVPADMGDIPLDDAMDLYFRYFGQINIMANKAESNFENGIVACTIYTLLLKMIDMSITIRGCGTETIAKVLPPSIITKNGLNAYSQLGQNNFALIDRCINRMEFSIEFMEALMERLSNADDLNELIDGTISTAYAFELLEMATDKANKDIVLNRSLIKKLHNDTIDKTEKFFDTYGCKGHDEIHEDLNVIEEQVSKIAEELTIFESSAAYTKAYHAAKRIEKAIDKVVNPPEITAVNNEVHSICSKLTTIPEE